jgi:hypothetical protein
LIKTAREKKTVFLAFDSQKNNYSNLSNKEIMFHINLDEEELITKENVNYKLLRPTKSLKTFLIRTMMKTIR